MIYDYVQTKPPLNEETLAHYGIKGMRWGVRNWILKSNRKRAGKIAERIKNRQNKRIAKGKPPKTLKTRTYKQMNIDKSDSAVTKRVKNDFNSLNDQEFMTKYKTSKKRYQKRVKKWGDPYKHRINSTSYKMLQKTFGQKRGK